eukprot:9344696-Pyramimonas_sp.AAC.1
MEPQYVWAVRQKGSAPSCELRRWDLRGAPLWGHEAREGRAKMGRRRRANCGVGTLHGAPYGATKRV